MSNPFFDRPIVNSPYEYPRQHWELDATGQPTGQLLDRRRRAEFITPIPKPKKRRGSRQEELDLDEGKGLSTKKQAYDLTSIINEVRAQVDTWRNLPASQWQVTPETARLLHHWRHQDVRPSTLLFHLTKRLVYEEWRDAGEDPKLHLFGHGCRRQP